jgi:putative ABC transport system ATP-binding protein
MVMETLFRMRAESGATLMLITHDQALAGRCDRIVRIADGRVV